MKLSAQEEYGLRCLLQMGRRGPDKIHTIPEISREEGLSSHHVAKLMRILRRGGLVISARGQAGGYRLARPPEEITVAVALRALGGQIFSSGFCKRHSGQRTTCTHDQDCSIRPLWRALQSLVEQVLERATLTDLLAHETEVAEWLLHQRVGIDGSFRAQEVTAPATM